MKYIYVNECDNSDVKPYRVPLSRVTYDFFSEGFCSLPSIELDDLYITSEQKDYYSNVRKVYVSVVSYLPPALVKRVCDYYVERNIAVSYIYIVHDMDKNQDGSDKKAHCHILLHMSTNYQLARFVSDFHTMEVQPLTCDKIGNAVAYLTHSTASCEKEGKYVYDKSDLVSNNLSFWINFKYEEVNIAMSMFMDIVDSRLSRVSMLNKYGLNYLNSYKKLSELIQDVAYHECPESWTDQGYDYSEIAKYSSIVTRCDHE